jgi:hypothetical protein
LGYGVWGMGYGVWGMGYGVWGIASRLKHKTRKCFFAPRFLAAEPGQVKRFAALRRPLYAARSHKAAIWPAPEAFLAGPRPAAPL